MSEAMIPALGGMGEACRYFVYLLNWNSERGKFDKKPVGSPAAARMTYAQAHAEAMRLRDSGQQATVGLWIAAESGLFFLDIDRLPGDYTPDERARQLVEMFPDAFVEWSSSKRGLHVVGRMAAPTLHGNRNDAMHLELYTENRGIALNIDAEPSGSMDSVHDVAALVAQYFPPREIVAPAGGGLRPEWRGPADDEELMRRMLRAMPSAESVFGDKPSLRMLLTGEPEQTSENDMALAAHLAFWTGCDVERIERIMRRTRLVRAKWDTKRGSTTYLRYTITNACAGCANVYQEAERAPPPLPPAARGEVRNAADLMGLNFSPVQWAVRGILPEGVTILSGDPKIGKSWLVYQMCVAVAAGLPLWTGRAPEVRGETLYLDLEGNDRRLQRRLRTLLKGFPGADIGHLHFATEWPRAEEGVAMIAEWLRKHSGCRLVVIDTVSAFRDNDPGRKSAYAHDYAVGEMLKPLAKEFSCAIVLVMHNRKQTAGDVMHKVSGTQGMTGSVDNVLVLERDRGDLDAALHVDGRDIEEPAQLAMRFENGLWRCIGNVDDVQRSKERTTVIEALKTMRGVGTARDIHAAIPGKQYGTVRTMLHRMVKSGELRLDGGIYTVGNLVPVLNPPRGIDVPTH